MELSDARVLVVDDEPALCEIFAQWMKMAGCRTIRTARNGELALAAVREAAIDVLVTDVRMPLMDGVTLVRRLVEQGMRIPTIIFVSGFGDVDQKEMYGLGVEAFLAKPLRRDELMGAVQRAIADRGSLWSERMEITPRQALDVVVQEDSFRLGRGGFSVACPKALSTGRVTFHCSMEGGGILAGQGFVRWYSRREERVGIEFGYLEAVSRDWVLNAIAASDPIGFVPGE